MNLNNYKKYLTVQEKIETAVLMLFYIKWVLKNDLTRTDEILIWLIDDIIRVLES